MSRFVGSSWYLADGKAVMFMADSCGNGVFSARVNVVKSWVKVAGLYTYGFMLFGLGVAKVRGFTHFSTQKLLNLIPIKIINFPSVNRSFTTLSTAPIISHNEINK